MTVVQRKWGTTNVKQVFRNSFYQSDQVYLDLKAGGAGISLSLMVDFFASKVGTNATAEASSSSEPPRLFSRAVAKAYILYILGAFLFPTKKGTDVSPNLSVSSRVNAKALPCYTTLLESWIFEHFLKLPGIPKPNDSRASEYCTRWSWSRMTSDKSSKKALKTFREELDNYKLEDVVWDPYLEKRADRHVFKKVACFTGFIRSPEYIEAYYPNRVQCQFNRMQYMPRNPICLEDRSLHFAVQPILGDGGGGGVGSPVGGGVGGGFLQREHVQGQNEDIISRLEEEISNLKLEKEVAESKLFEAIKLKTDECERLKESNDNLQAKLQAKQVPDSICEIDFSETEKNSLKETNKKLSEDVSSLMKTLADLNVQLQKKEDECDKLASINEKLMDELINLQPQPLALNLVPHSDANVAGAEDWKQKLL
ncbi:hypothetical protein GIB67_017139, partial [Kingdonia uniflora]